MLKENKKQFYTISLDLNRPQLKLFPSENVYESDSVVMTCDVDGTKPIVYQWYKNGIKQMSKNEISNIYIHKLSCLKY